MKIDKIYAASSYLMYRRIIDQNINFTNKFPVKQIKIDNNRERIEDSFELELYLKNRVENICKNKKCALMLSGGIDSAILAKYMPKGSVAYTMKCIVPGIDVVDESPVAAKYAQECGLVHKTVEIYWEDYEQYSEALMKNKGAPIHSIEVQIMKLAQQAKKDGFNTLVCGEAADCMYGGLSNLLSQDWTFGEFVSRYTFLLPYKVLKNSILELEPYKEFEKNGYIDVHEFLRNIFYQESLGSYINSSEVSKIDLISPYSETYMNVPLDYERVRKGENKYFVREIFNRLYDNFEIPPKLPMPRATNEWLANWEGPKRAEFWENCTENLTGDQKWLVYALEKFLNMIDKLESKD